MTDGWISEISDDILNCILLQIAPGYDRATLEEIGKVFGHELTTYIGFGRYDLIILDERKDLSLLNKFYESKLTHVKDWLPVWGLRWKVRKIKKAQLPRGDRVLGLSFVKLDLDHALDRDHHAPLQEEERIAQLIKSRSAGEPYCSLGFNELIVINSAKNFGELGRKIVSLKESLLVEKNQEKTPVALDICTVPAIQYDVLLQSSIKMCEPIEIVLLLSLPMGLNRQFEEQLRKIAKDSITIFGAHDVMLRLSGATGDVVREIEFIRNEGSKHGLYTSFTIIPIFDNVLNFVVYPPRFKSQTKPSSDSLETKTIDDDRFKFFKKWIEACVRDPLTKHIFADQMAFFQNNEELTKTLDSNPEAIDPILECARIGFEQRCSTLNPGNLLGAKSIRTEHLGSLQRTTMSIESLPLFLFDKTGYGKWPGFCIHGYIDRFFRTEGGIINVPGKYRVSPEDCWGVLHEVGHEIFQKIEQRLKAELLDELEAIIDGVKHAFEGKRKIDEFDLQEDYTAFAEEIFAEVFGFHFGFNDDWKMYVSLVWSYFVREMIPGPNYQHISRSILAYLTFGPGRNLARDQVTIERIDRIIQELDEVTKKDGITLDEADKNAAIPIVLTFLNVADIVRSHFIEKPCLWDKGKLKDIDNTLGKGLISYSDNPLEILFAFVTSKHPHTYKGKLATILSLYNCYCKYLNEPIGGRTTE